jgi:hypothetical protein
LGKEEKSEAKERREAEKERREKSEEPVSEGHDHLFSHF